LVDIFLGQFLQAVFDQSRYRSVIEMHIKAACLLRNILQSSFVQTRANNLSVAVPQILVSTWGDWNK
jgi:hypothetical protein